MINSAIPLFHDHHSHPLLYASMRKAVNLENVKSKSIATGLLQEASEQLGDQRLVLAMGWRSDSFQWTIQELAELPPVAIFNISLHQLEVNDEGREQLRQKFGDDVDRIEDQDWYERNLRSVLNWFAGLNATNEYLVSFFEDLLAIGIESAEEMLLVDEREIELFESSGLIDRTRFWSAPETFDRLSAEAKTKVHGLKLFTDGALGARTAALNQPYLQQPGNLGMLMYEEPEFFELVQACLQRTPNLAVHAIGDRAIEQTVTALQISSRSFPTDGVRIEHAQLIDLKTAKQAKELGVTLSMQPNFNSDSVNYSDRISDAYCRSNNPFRMLIDDVGFVCGEDLVFGSDGMPHGSATAIREGVSEALPHQKLTMDELVAGYTR